MAVPMSRWFKKKSDANRFMRALIRGGYPKSSVYVASAKFKYGPFDKPITKKEYRVMKRKGR